MPWLGTVTAVVYYPYAPADAGSYLRKGISMSTATTTTTDQRETVSLIGSDKVEGTAVYGADQKKIGSLQRVMIDKISGKVAYAVVSFGGFLGMGLLGCVTSEQAARQKRAAFVSDGRVA
jgi:hypothetical protein